VELVVDGATVELVVDGATVELVEKVELLVPADGHIA